MSKKITLVTWVPIEEIEKFEELKKVIPSPIYDECPCDVAHRDIVIKELIDNDYIICGDTHQYSCIPVLSDGYFFVSMRVWAILMAEAMNVKEKTDKYNYMDFYVASVCRFQERRPGEDV